jgi:uncharacterized protein YnzC (UPF0291/DUF896 family)
VTKVLGKEKLGRLNELAKKAKNEGLTPEETKERDALRQEYLENFRSNFRQRLENIEIVYEDELEDKK